MHENYYFSYPGIIRGAEKAGGAIVVIIYQKALQNQEC